jgi:predicted ester cyclase
MWTDMSQEVTVSDSRSVLELLFAAGDAGDLDAFRRLMHEDVVVHAPAGLSTRGVESEKESWRRARAAMPGLHHEFVDVLATPALEAARTVVTGTFDGTYGGLTVHGRRFEFDQAIFAHLRDGKITEMWEIVDVDSLRGQLGDE